MDEVGAIEVFGSALCGGTRSEAAAEGGGRINPFPGRGGAAMPPNVGGFRRGGLVDLVPIVDRAGERFSFVPFSSGISGIATSPFLAKSVSIAGRLRTTGGSGSVTETSFEGTAIESE